jgi:hypothetical protein
VTFEQRVDAVAAMGFDRRRAQFLALVALHSGYCLRRQYAEFTGVVYGKNVRDFLDHLVKLGVARRLTFRRDRGHIYHLFARSIYSALQQQDNRNRRHASPALIARKLMLLDFVLLQPDREWYVTEDEKVDLFLNTFGLPSYAIPHRTYTGARPAVEPTVRYCVQKLPLFVTREPLKVHFVCLVTDASARDIPVFLREHASLLTQLPYSLVVVRPAHISTDDQCRAAFALGTRCLTAPAGALDSPAISWYFEARRRIELGELRTLSVEDIRRYRVCRRRAAGTLEGAYRRWVELGYPTFGRIQELAAPAGGARGNELILVPLPHRYEQFGAMPGVV